MREEIRNWLTQAKADLEAARDSLKFGHYEWACFQSQQSAEKALKALYIHRRRTGMVTHNLVALAKALRVPRTIAEACRELNADYVTARYPDAANGVPAEQYSKEMGQRHVKAGEKIFQWAKSFLR